MSCTISLTLAIQIYFPTMQFKTKHKHKYIFLIDLRRAKINTSSSILLELKSFLPLMKQWGVVRKTHLTKPLNQHNLLPPRKKCRIFFNNSPQLTSQKNTQIGIKKQNLFWRVIIRLYGFSLELYIRFNNLFFIFLDTIFMSSTT